MTTLAGITWNANVARGRTCRSIRVLNHGGTMGGGMLEVSYECLADGSKETVTPTTISKVTEWISARPTGLTKSFVCHGRVGSVTYDHWFLGHEKNRVRISNTLAVTLIEAGLPVRY